MRPVIGDKLFVYGTLRPGERAWDMLRGSVRLVHVNAALAGARMYSINDRFPGAVLGAPADDVIIGDLFEITNKDLPHRLDNYEGYPQMYDRKKVTTLDGIEAWVYTFNYPVDEFERIESGNWKKRDLKKAA